MQGVAHLLDASLRSVGSCGIVMACMSTTQKYVSANRQDSYGATTGQFIRHAEMIDISILLLRIEDRRSGGEA